MSAHRLDVAGRHALVDRRYDLFPVAAAGQPGVERALGLMRAGIERGMTLMGCTSVDRLRRESLCVPRGRSGSRLPSGKLDR